MKAFFFPGVFRGYKIDTLATLHPFETITALFLLVEFPTNMKISLFSTHIHKITSPPQETRLEYKKSCTKKHVPFFSKNCTLHKNIKIS